MKNLLLLSLLVAGCGSYLESWQTSHGDWTIKFDFSIENNRYVLDVIADGKAMREEGWVAFDYAAGVVSLTATDSPCISVSLERPSKFDFMMGKELTLSTYLTSWEFTEQPAKIFSGLGCWRPYRKTPDGSVPGWIPIDYYDLPDLMALTSFRPKINGEYGKWMFTER